MKDDLDTMKQLAAEIDEMRQFNKDLQEVEEARHMALDSLRESEERFRSVAQSAVDAIISSDSNDIITFWNQGATKIFGYSEEEALGKSVTIIIPDQYKDLHRNGMKRFLESGRTSLIGRTIELQGLKKNGQIFPIELSLSYWKTTKGTFFAGIIRDISDRKEAEAALETRTEEAKQRSEELEALIQMVAHDLKSPVITIVGMVKRLQKKVSQMPEGHECNPILKQIGSAAENIEKFLSDLLNGLVVDYTRPELTCISMPALLEDILERRRSELKDRNFEIRKNIIDGLPPVMGDQHRIMQVIDNLVSNAIKYMGENSTPVLTLNVRKHDAFIMTSVIDNGQGISEGHQTKIFDRFYRVRKGSVSGTGLGLSISKKIIQDHGGKIWVESKPGSGSSFSFILPITTDGCS